MAKHAPTGLSDFGRALIEFLTRPLTIVLSVLALGILELLNRLYGPFGLGANLGLFFVLAIAILAASYTKPAGAASRLLDRIVGAGQEERIRYLLVAVVVVAAVLVPRNYMTDTTDDRLTVMLVIFAAFYVCLAAIVLLTGGLARYRAGPPERDPGGD